MNLSPSTYQENAAPFAILSHVETSVKRAASGTDGEKCPEIDIDIHDLDIDISIEYPDINVGVPDLSG